MNGKTCVITGATSGIGRAAALALGKLGARLVLLGRNESAGQDVVHRIRKSGAEAEFFRADLSSLSEVRKVAERIRQQHSQLDVLVNNAGARFDTYQKSADGFELTFATNHLGHFLLTCLLSDLLLAAPAARVITVASCAHAAAQVADGEWQLPPTTYHRHQAYARSKLANILFAYELADRFKATPATSNAVDPGIVATRFGCNNGFLSWAKHLIYHGARRELVSARRAAETIVFLASAPEAKAWTAKYFYEQREIRSSAASYDRGSAQQLWHASRQWTSPGGDAAPVPARVKPEWVCV
jgi:NAD(P)-dependent dehydrogenase (short-subunit alcohol dehydrogenase family)